jgi:cell division protein FtsI (penicillin-binding protein 3)
VHKPSTALNNYYGADVAGPVSRELHKKYLPMRLQQMKLKNLNKKIAKQEDNYESYYANLRKAKICPILKECQEWMPWLY